MFKFKQMFNFCPDCVSGVFFETMVLIGFGLKSNFSIELAFHLERVVNVLI